jgi:energy-coupling factor transporter ATP-binding protein EcfA2
MADIQQVYRLFSPAPLCEGQDNLYVDLDPVRGSAGLLRSMARKIRFSDQPTCQVIAGHRGSGKSTELWRLAGELTTPKNDQDSKYAVVTLRALEVLDPNDVDVPELIPAVVRQVAETLRAEPYKIELKPGYFQQLLPRLKGALQTEIELTGADLATPLGTIGLAVKNSPDARAEVRKTLEPHTGTLLQAANDVIGQAVAALAMQGRMGLVVIVDDLDKMIARPHVAAGCTTTEYLFVHRSAQLTGLDCHTVYSIPIELAYSSQGPTISSRYGGTLHMVPMTKVTAPPPERVPYEDGITLLAEVVRARAEAAGAGLDDLFETDRLRELILFTGGQPTELMTMTREAIIAEGLPIGAPGIKRCKTEAERGYRRLLMKEHQALLREVAETGQVTRSDTTEPILRDLLASRTILLYRNDDEWYDLNPAARDLV